MKKIKEKDEFDLEENNSVKTPKTELFKKILWYTGAIIVVLFTVWGVIQFMVNKELKNIDVNQKLEIIVKTQTEQKKQNDSILVNIVQIKQLIKENTETVQDLSNSYVLFMQNNKSLTKDDFRNYMEGVTWEVKKNMTNTVFKPKEKDSLNSNIIITKINK
jgi:tetrahydromethanopterin S-methyltransferase subunit B